MSIIYGALGVCLNICYNLVKNYGWAIVLFTLLSKIVLLPVSIWVQKNSIKMVRMQPEINRIKIKYFGDKDTIDDKLSAIYKREKYNPFASIIPLTIQIVLLIGLVAVIRDADKYIHVQNGVLDKVFLGLDLSVIPAETLGISIIVPLIAGFSAFLLSLAQNTNNVLQAEQSNVSKYGMMAFSVCLSLFLGFYVPAGVALYWICSNLFAILQQYLLNFMINPKKYVDFEELEKTREELKKYGNIDGKKKISREDKKRERADYKRFFSVLNKHLVFYSESSGFYKYFAGFIDYILKNSKLTIHYITSDPNDNIFKIAQKESRIRAYYIGETRLITLMMKIEADMVVMTMPDLQNFHIKRSYIKKDIEYLYVPHDMNSHNLLMRKGCEDHYDSVFCTGKHQVEELRKSEELYGTKPKKLIECGYVLLDDMVENYKKMDKTPHDKKQILISPSWQVDNIVDNCLGDILEALQGHGYKITVRPHPQQVKNEPEKMESLKKRFEDDPDIEIQTDFSSNSTVFEADAMITDWSGIALEYAYTTYNPVLFVNTPMKVMHPDSKEPGIEPLNIWIH
ncbi:MAG: membrane protein insertase YidC, partial [Lachnospiraceae bacterium]|nr:membrane protein insertase YidC [Lachnospiraceae bacterium]